MRRTLACSVVCLALVAGCAPTAPAPPPPPARPAQALLAAFAAAWGDRTSPAGRRALIALSAGPLRTTLERASLTPAPDVAAQARRSPSVETVEGVLLRPGRPALVVTRAVTRFAAGGTQETYSVYLARIERVDAAWRVVQWTPVQ